MNNANMFYCSNFCLSAKKTENKIISHEQLIRLPVFGNIDVQQSRNLQYGGR